MAQSREWNDGEIIAAIDAEEQQALGGDYDELTDDRAKALRWYRRHPLGNEQEGRSAIVSGMIADQVEAVMPSIARVFLSGDEIGRFDPVGPEDEEAAEVESQVVNLAIVKGGGYQAIYSAAKDALLLRNGFILVHWHTAQSIITETYNGLSDDEAAMLLADGDVRAVEHTEYPDVGSQLIDPQTGMPLPPAMLHDIKVERVKPVENIRLEAVPPDEVLVSARHRSVCLADSDFVQMRRRMSIGELREAGYEVPDDASDDDLWTEEDNARQRFDEDYAWQQDETGDPARKIVLFRQTWILLDIRGSGKPQLWRVCSIGNTIIHREEADLIPIANLAPVWYPHSSIGVSYFDLLEDLALWETTLQRQMLDSLYLSTSGRTAIDANRVNLDDLLITRPGGIVRVEGEPGSALMPLVSPDVGPTAMAGLEYIANIKENRTGISRVNQGALDPNALNRTATGVQLMQNAGQSRIELLTRCLAEGIKDLFLIAHAVLLKHSTRPMQMRLRNKWVSVHPREWVRRTDFDVSVALGTGSAEQQLSKLQMLSQQVPQLVGMGLMGPRQIYNLSVETLRVAGYRTPDRFLIEPKEGAQMPQPSPPPEVLAAQAMAQGQVERAKVDGQAGMQKAQIDAQATLTKAQTDAQTDLQKAEMQAQWRYKEKLLEVAARTIAEVQKGQYAAMEQQREFEHDFQMEAVEQSGEMAAGGMRQGDESQANQAQAAMMQALMAMAQQLERAVSQMNAPREVVRGPDGKAIGIRSVSMQ